MSTCKCGEENQSRSLVGVFWERDVPAIRVLDTVVCPSDRVSLRCPPSLRKSVRRFSQLTPVKFPVGCTNNPRQSRPPASHDRNSKIPTVPLGAMLGIVPFKVLKSEVASFWAVLFPREGGWRKRLSAANQR